MNIISKKFCLSALLFNILLSSTADATCVEDIENANWLMAQKSCTEEANSNGPTKGQALFFMGIITSIQVDPAIEVNNTKSFEYFQKSADANFFPAYCALSDAYFHGNGTPENPEKSFYWAQKSAASGDADGAIYLSYFYNTGYGTSADIDSAKLWLMVARLKIDDFDQTTQEYFDSLIGVMSTDNRVVLMQQALDCINSNYQSCSITKVSKNSTDTVK